MIEGARPEVELVCRCLTPSLDPAGRDRIETLLDADPDWGFLVEFATHHGVVGSVHRRLVGEYGDALDASVHTRLDTMQRAQTTRNLGMVSALHELLDRFDAERVRALPIKGPVLAAASQGSISRRTFNDLDILVHEREMSRALDVMESMGYERDVDAPRLDDAAILGGPLTPPLLDKHTLQRPDENVTVEIGWQVGSDPYSFRAEFDTLWNRRESTTVAGRSVPSLAPDDRLLLLTYHGVKHGFALLKWVSDVAETVHADPELDWSGLYRRAAEYGTTRRLVVGIGVASRLLDVDVPGLRARLDADETATKLVTEVHDRLVNRPLCELAAVDTTRFYLSASESRRTRLSTKLLTTSLHPTLAEYRLLPLPGLLHPVYYLVRPLRLFVVYVLLNRPKPQSV